MVEVSNCFPCCSSGRENTEGVGCELPPWLGAILMLIVAAGALYGCDCLSGTSNWTWLTNGTLSGTMWVVVVTAIIVEAALLYFTFSSCCKEKEKISPEFLRFTRNGEDESVLPPESVIKTLPPPLPLPLYYSPRGPRKPFPGEVHIYYHDPNTWKREEQSVGRIMLDGFPPSFSDLLDNKDKDISFAQLYEKMQTSLGALLPKNYYFAILKQKSNGQWGTWYPVENQHRIRDWVSSTPLCLWVLDADKPLQSTGPSTGP